MGTRSVDICNFRVDIHEHILVGNHTKISLLNLVVNPVSEWLLDEGCSDIDNPLPRKASHILIVGEVSPDALVVLHVAKYLEQCELLV